MSLHCVLPYLWFLLEYFAAEGAGVTSSVSVLELASYVEWPDSVAHPCVGPVTAILRGQSLSAD